MAASDFNVKYVAHLARIQLSPEEEQKLGAQLGNILGFMEKLKALVIRGELLNGMLKTINLPLLRPSRAPLLLVLLFFLL